MIEQDEISVKSGEKPTKEYSLADSPFSWDMLDGLLSHKVTLKTCSEQLNCPASTIQDHIKKRYGLSFENYAEKRLIKTKIKLINKAISMAEGGNVAMLIFCLKNLCGWADKIDQDTTVKTLEVKLAYPEE